MREINGPKVHDAIDQAIALLYEARGVVAESDTFAMASDGPVMHARAAMTNEQFDRMWARIAKARVLLEECRYAKLPCVESGGE